jgi:hypothetical protein
MDLPACLGYRGKVGSNPQIMFWEAATLDLIYCLIDSPFTCVTWCCCYWAHTDLVVGGN